MYFEKVNENSIEKLYKLNKELAKEENQEALFTANFKEYKELFEKDAKAYLIYKEKRLIGFFIYINKIATYLGKRVLYLEDLYIKKEYLIDININETFNFIKKLAKQNEYARIEMRVLKNFNIEKEKITQNEFSKVEKWDVYRINKT